jgi:hypothetical protein
MMLAETFLEILDDWRPAFPQQRTHLRAARQAVGSLVALGRRTVTRILWCLGREQHDWTAEYRLFSQSPWRTQDLFAPVLKRALPWCAEDHVEVAFDNTSRGKTGRKITDVSWMKHPLSPPFWINLRFGLRFLQGSLLVPLYRQHDAAPRALPISFEEVATVKKPKRGASEETKMAYAEAKKEHNLSQAFLRMLGRCRQELDRLGAKARVQVAVVDGSFCNGAVFRNDVERSVIVARSRKDAKLCHPEPAGSRRTYGQKKFTPEEVRKDPKIPWRETRIFHGNEWRAVRYKELKPVLWQRASGPRPIRLFVVAPIPYRTTAAGKIYYRRPAFLLSTDVEMPADVLLQAYFDRWQIEVNFREEKTDLGLGQAQVRTPRSVQRQPALVVASYSALLLAGLLAFGPHRSDAYLPLPKWRRNAKRPSCLDLITLLRKELTDKPTLLQRFQVTPTPAKMVTAAAA